MAFLNCSAVITRCSEISQRCGPCQTDKISEPRMVVQNEGQPVPNQNQGYQVPGSQAAKDTRDPLFLLEHEMATSAKDFATDTQPYPGGRPPTLQQTAQAQESSSFSRPDLENKRTSQNPEGYLPVVVETSSAFDTSNLSNSPDPIADAKKMQKAEYLEADAGAVALGFNLSENVACKPVASVTEDPRTMDQDEPEPEEEQTYNARREFVKCSVCALFILLLIVSIGVFVAMMSKDFTDPVCPTTSRRLELDELLLGKLLIRELRSASSVVLTPPKSCEPCSDNTLVLPLGKEWEKSLSKGGRAALYFLGLVWCFLGVAIVCDQFMAAIEEITSAEKSVWLKVHGGSKHKFHVHIWNPTVANLTLMALGSSAPEILLSVIELCGNDFFSGKLGPSTIVGSAAFNLLVITAVCISAIPAPDTRKIDQMEVFAVTATFSLAAYVWLLVMLQYNSKDLVEPWEALVTLLCFPVLIILAFIADKGWLKCSKRAGADDKPSVSNEDICAEQRKLQVQYGKSVSASHVKAILEEQEKRRNKKTQAHYRRSVLLNVGGLPSNKPGVDVSNEITFGFMDRKHLIMECAGEVQLKVVASRAPGCVVEMRYYTRDGQAKSGVRYTHVEGTLRFEPHETEKTITVPIVDNEVWEGDEEFSVELADLQSGKASIVFGIPWTQVWVLNDDEPGMLAFAVDEVMACEGVSSVAVGVSRNNGTFGAISCHFETQEDSAVAGEDYTHVEGEVSFESGQTNQMIEIPLLNKRRSDPTRFRVLLNNPSQGVKFDPTTDGGEMSAICEVVLSGSSKSSCIATRCFSRTKFWRAMGDWQEQFPAALYCGGDAKEQASASPKDWIFHGVSLFWKVVFAFTPPARLAGGWPCFVWALGMIGVVTAIVGDMASLLGCCISLPDDITAITLVALGTSLPDTFASKTAAQHDENADNSIGNVTGSNSVNVFLGLGLPWTIGAYVWSDRGKTKKWEQHIYRKKTYQEQFGNTYPDGGLMVPAGSLSFSVLVFVATASLCIMLLLFRRKKYGGELGGPKSAQMRDSILLGLLWCVYIGASIAQSLAEGEG